MLTQERLKHLLYYDPDTGIWLWNNPNLRNRDFGAMRGIACCGRKLSVSVCGQYLGMFDRIEEAVAVRDFALWYNGATA